MSAEKEKINKLFKQCPSCGSIDLFACHQQNIHFKIKVDGDTLTLLEIPEEQHDDGVVDINCNNCDEFSEGVEVPKSVQYGLHEVSH